MVVDMPFAIETPPRGKCAPARRSASSAMAFGASRAIALEYPEIAIQRVRCDLDNDVAAEPEARKFLVEIDEGETDAAKVSANMRHVLLHFHGHRYAEGDAQLQRWIDLFNEGLQFSDSDSNLAWEGICVALIRHPDFYSL